MNAHFSAEPFISHLFTIYRGVLTVYERVKQKREQKASRLRRSRQRKLVQQRSQRRLLS